MIVSAEKMKYISARQKAIDESNKSQSPIFISQLTDEEKMIVNKLNQRKMNNISSFIIQTESFADASIYGEKVQTGIQNKESGTQSYINKMNEAFVQCRANRTFKQEHL